MSIKANLAFLITLFDGFWKNSNNNKDQVVSLRNTLQNDYWELLRILSFKLGEIGYLIPY